MKVCALIALAGRESPEFCFLHDSPEGFHSKRRRLTQGEPAGDDFPSDARIPMSDEESGIVVPDVVGNNRGFLIVSARLAQAIEPLALPVEVLPVSILNHKGRVASKDHFILNPLGSHDCLDLATSEIKYLEGDVVEVKKYVFAPSKLKTLPHMFRVKEWPRTIVLADDVLKAWLTLDPEPTNLVIETAEISPR